MGPRAIAPKRGELYSIDPNPVAGREMKDRHFWIVLTPEPINRLGVSIVVVVSTVAAGAREAGITVHVSDAGVTGVAICTQVRTFDIRARIADKNARLVGTVRTSVVDEIAAKVASLIGAP